MSDDQAHPCSLCGRVVTFGPSWLSLRSTTARMKPFDRTGRVCDECAAAISAKFDQEIERRQRAKKKKKKTTKQKDTPT